MGRGDRKSKKGKLWLGTFGIKRKRKTIPEYIKPAVAETPVVPATPVVKAKPEPKPKAEKAKVS